MTISRFAVAIVAVSLVAVSAAVPQDAMVKGEIKKIDTAANKITLKHGPIKNLDMDEDGMTMVFRVQDSKVLKQVKTGDKVRFRAERGSNGLTITSLQKVERAPSAPKARR